MSLEKPGLALIGCGAIAIAAPSHLHAEQSCTALAAGKHVICEVPGALTVEEGDRIVQAQRTSGRAVAFLSSRLRCAGYTNLARHYRSSGKLGRIYRVEAVYYYDPQRRSANVPSTSTGCADRSRSEGGILQGMGLYLLDQVLELLNWPRVQTLCAHSFLGAGKDTQGQRANGFKGHEIMYARLASDIAMSMNVAAK